MDIASILRTGWRITWHCWPVWLLNLLMFITAIPALLLSGTLGGIAGLLSTSRQFEALPGMPQSVLSFLQNVPGWGWLLVLGGACIPLILFTTLAWGLQAASIRAINLAAAEEKVSVRAALQLGRQRITGIFKLSLTFGVLSLLLALFPLALMLVVQNQAGRMLGQLSQTSLIPVNTVLGIALFLIMMSIAVEDLSLGSAMRRSWQVFRKGWWGFLLVYSLTFVGSLGVVGLLIPLLIVVPLAVLAPPVGLVMLGLLGCLLAPLTLFGVLFMGVFTTTLYTLVYRAAQPGPAPAI